MIVDGPYPRGPRVHFRPLVKEDSTGPYLEWINDPRVRRFLVFRAPRLEPPDLEAYIEEMNTASAEFVLAVCRNDNGLHSGNIKLENISRDHLTASMSIVIGDAACWGQGIGTEVIALMTRYGFERLGLLRIDSGCFADNLGSVRAFEKCGYLREGLSRELYSLDGKRMDAVRMGLLVTDPPAWKAFLD